MTAQPSETVHALLAAWNARDIDLFISMLSPEVEWYDLGMPHPPARGREEVRAFSCSVLAAFPDFQYAIEPPLCVSTDGRRCVAIWGITATHTGEMIPPGFAPTNRSAAFRGVDVFDFQDGKVLRILTLFDPLHVVEQLTGLSLRPPRGSFHERLFVALQRIVAFFSRRGSNRPGD